MRKYIWHTVQWKSSFTSFILFLLCLTNICATSVTEASPLIDKKFVYYIFWSGIRAGKAELDFSRTADETIVRTRATSASFISLFYKVDDRAESTLFPDGYPKSFTLKVREGFHRRNKATYFQRGLADRPQKVIFHNVLDDKKVQFILDKPAYDPLSAFYAMTQRPLLVGQSEFIDIFDNKKLWHTEIQIIKKEKIKVMSREYDTILVKPLLKSEGIFRKTGDILIWVTDDDRKIPVLFKSKAPIGSFSAKLADGDF